MSAWPTVAVGAERGILVPGLENVLPPGEEPLWVGRPDETTVSRHVTHTRKLVLYFGVLVALRSIMLVNAQASPAALIDGLVWLGILAAATVVFAHGLSVLVARTTTYVLTPRRVVMRIGVAIPITINIPLRQIEAVSLRELPGGFGDITLTLGRGVRIAYLLLWPHARPWFLRAPQPSLRAVADAATVGARLAAAVGSEESAKVDVAMKRDDERSEPVAAPANPGFRPRSRELAGTHR